jgi:hypothetical protein
VQQGRFVPYLCPWKGRTSRGFGTFLGLSQSSSLTQHSTRLGKGDCEADVEPQRACSPVRPVVRLLLGPDGVLDGNCT